MCQRPRYLLFSRKEIQGQEGLTSTSFFGHRALMLVGHVVPQRRQEIGSKLASSAIHVLQEIPIKKRGEETLSNVLSGLARRTPASDEKVDRFPIGLDQGLKGLPTFGCFRILGCQDYRPERGSKGPLRSADLGGLIGRTHPSVIIQLEGHCRAGGRQSRRVTSRSNHRI